MTRLLPGLENHPVSLLLYNTNAAAGKLFVVAFAFYGFLFISTLMLISRFMFLKCSGSRKLVVLCRLSVEEIRMKYGGMFPSERWVSPGDAELWDQKPSGDFISCFYPFFSPPASSSAMSSLLLFLTSVLLLHPVWTLDFRYHLNSEIEQYLIQTSKSNPNITHLYSIGKSVRGKEL